MNDRTGIIIASVFISITALWCVIVSLWQPSVSIMADSQPYHPLLWIISLSALAIPLCHYLSESHFRSLETHRRFLLLGLALITTSMVHSLRCFIDTQFVFIATTLVYLFLDPARRYRRPAWQFWFVVLYVAWNLITLIYTPDLHYGFKFGRNFIPLILYPLLFLAFSLTDHELTLILKLLWRVVLMAVLLSFLSGIYEITASHHPLTGLLHLRIGMIKETFFDDQGVEQFVFNMLYAWSGNGHPSFNAIWAVAGAISGTWLVKRRIIGWIEFSFGLFVIIALQFSAQSRIGISMVLLTFAAAYIFLLWPRHRRMLFSSLALIFVIILTSFMLKPDLLGSFGRDDARDRLWSLAFEFISLRPLTGTGLGGTDAEYVSSVLGYPWPWPEHAHENIYVHNQFLGDWMQTGLPGFILSITMFTVTLLLTIRRRSYNAFVFLLAMLLLMIIEMPLRIIQGSTLISFFLCLFLQNEARHGRE